MDVETVDCINEKGYPAKQTNDNVEDLLLDEHRFCLFVHSGPIEPLVSEYQRIASHPEVNQILNHLKMTKRRTKVFFKPIHLLNIRVQERVQVAIRLDQVINGHAC